MLLTIVDTKKFGKFVLHKFPYEKVISELEVFERNSTSDIIENVIDLFEYFGIYNKKQVIKTEREPLPEKTVVDLFIANEKFSQVVLGIDDNCVLISKSVFMSKYSIPRTVRQQNCYNSDNVSFVDLNDETDSIVNSISVVYCQQNYDGLQNIKNKLSFLLGVFERKEQSSQFLTKQIYRVMQAKERIRKRIKDILGGGSRDLGNFQQIKIKIYIKQIYQEVKRIRQSIDIFTFIKEFYENWKKDAKVKIKEGENSCWEGTTTPNFFMGEISDSYEKEIENKTIVILPLKISDSLPPVLNSQRVQKLYEKGFSENNNISFKNLLQKHRELNKKQFYHTVHFLLKNNLAVAIYPINHPHSYNLFTLTTIPSKHLIQKFNHKIFPNQNCLKIVNSYNNYRIVKEQEQTLKYLLLKDIIRQVKIFIYKKYEKETITPGQYEESINWMNSGSIVQQILHKYSMTKYDLNHILSVQHVTMNSLYNYMRANNKKWGFYFIQ